MKTRTKFSKEDLQIKNFILILHSDIFKKRYKNREILFDKVRIRKMVPNQCTLNINFSHMMILLLMN